MPFSRVLIAAEMPGIHTQSGIAIRGVRLGPRTRLVHRMAGIPES